MHEKIVKAILNKLYSHIIRITPKRVKKFRIIDAQSINICIQYVHRRDRSKERPRWKWAGKARNMFFLRIEFHYSRGALGNICMHIYIYTWAPKVHSRVSKISVRCKPGTFYSLCGREWMDASRREPLRFVNKMSHFWQVSNWKMVQVVELTDILFTLNIYSNNGCWYGKTIACVGSDVKGMLALVRMYIDTWLMCMTLWCNWNEFVGWLV